MARPRPRRTPRTSGRRRTAARPTPAAGTRDARTRAVGSKWRRIRVRLVAAAAAASTGIALATNAVSLPAKVQSAFGNYDSRTAELELAQKRAELAAAAPRIDVSYLILSRDLLHVPESLSSQDAITLVSFPELRNEVLDGVSAADPARCGFGPPSSIAVAFLVVENRGRRDATDVSVVLDRLALEKPVRVREAAVGGDDYVRALRRAARAAPAELRERVSRSLAPGAGVRVPLWIQATRIRSANPWCVVSGVALQPRAVTYADPVLESSKTVPVRRLASPVLYERGVEGRG